MSNTTGRSSIDLNAPFSAGSQKHGYFAPQNQYLEERTHETWKTGKSTCRDARADGADGCCICRTSVPGNGAGQCHMLGVGQIDGDDPGETRRYSCLAQQGAGHIRSCLWKLDNRPGQADYLPVSVWPLEQVSLVSALPCQGPSLYTSKHSPAVSTCNQPAAPLKQEILP